MLTVLTVSRSVSHTLPLRDFRLPSQVHSTLFIPSPFHQPVTLCMNDLNAYSLLFTGLLILILVSFYSGVKTCGSFSRLSQLLSGTVGQSQIVFFFHLLPVGIDVLGQLMGIGRIDVVLFIDLQNQVN